MEVTSELRLSVDGDQPRKAVEQFEELAHAGGVPSGTLFKFQLALDELLTNVVSYAFDDDASSSAVIKVMLIVTDSRIEAVIEDNGRPFNPLTDAAAPDLELSAEDRTIGGLGIHLTKAFVETLSYERTDGWNRLSLVQPFTAHPEENA